MATNLERMSVRAKRRNRPETLLRLLISTSYPHSTLADFTFAISKAGGQFDKTELSVMADDLTEVERKFAMNDFIRAVEITRDGPTVVIVIKQLELDPLAREIVDSVETHVELARCTVQLANHDQPMAEPERVASMILEFFRRTQQYEKANTMAQTEWRLRERPAGKKGNAKLNNTKVPAVETKLDFNQATAHVVTSLSKMKFHIVMTHNAVLLLDQQRTLR